MGDHGCADGALSGTPGWCPDASGYSPPTVEEFHSLEGLEAGSQASGWSVDYRQLEPGRLRSRMILGECAGISMSLETATCALEVVGESPPGTLAVALPVGGDRFWVNGALLDPHEFAVLAPGTELHAVTRGQVSVVAAHIPERWFETQARALAPRWTGLPGSGLTRVRLGAEAIGALRRSSVSALQPGWWQRWAEEQASELVSRIVTGVSRDDAAAGRSASFASHWRILRRARDYIDGHLHEPIRIPELCRYAGASLSTLERSFRRELGVTPTAYIRIRRLNSVHRELLRGEDPGRRIGRIALDHGFAHLGRFSAAYRAQFGVSPSETRAGSGRDI